MPANCYLRFSLPARVGYSTNLGLFGRFVKMYNNLHAEGVKTLNVSDFREPRLQLLDGLPTDGILITKRGRPVAKITPVPSSCSDLISTMQDLASDPQDKLFSTGVIWDG